MITEVLPVNLVPLNVQVVHLFLYVLLVILKTETKTMVAPVIMDSTKILIMSV